MGSHSPRHRAKLECYYAVYLGENPVRVDGGSTTKLESRNSAVEVKWLQPGLPVPGKCACVRGNPRM